MQKGEPFNAEKQKASIPRLKEEIETTGRYKELQQLLISCGIWFFLLPLFEGVDVRGFVKTTASNSLVLIKPDQRKNNKFYTEFFDLLNEVTKPNFSGSLVDY